MTVFYLMIKMSRNTSSVLHICEFRMFQPTEFTSVRVHTQLWPR